MLLLVALQGAAHCRVHCTHCSVLQEQLADEVHPGACAIDCHCTFYSEVEGGIKEGEGRRGTGRACFK